MTVQAGRWSRLVIALGCGLVLAGQAPGWARAATAAGPTGARDARELATAEAAAAAPQANPDETTAPLSLAAQLETPVTARFEAVDFEAAVAFLAENAGTNIILSEDAKTVGLPVTVHLTDMPLRRALEYLLKGQGLLFRYDGQTIWVATRDEMEAEPVETRVYFLNQGPGLFAAFEPLTETRESVALQTTGLQEVRTIRDILEEVVPQVGGSSILTDERSGALIVTHVPYYLEQVETLLAQLDISPPQVLIEARFVEITLTDTRELGLELALNENLSITTRESADGTDGAEFQLSSTGTTLARGTGVNFSSFTNQASGLNLTLQGILSGPKYSAVLHALKEDKRTKTLSAPRVTTLNNQTATIKIVTEFVYASRYEASVVREDLNSDGDFNDVVSGTRETRFVNVPQDFVTKDLGILLHVTPSVGQDLNTITLALKPEVSEKKTDDSFGGEISLPRFTSRYLETSVVIENGQTAVLGGLMKDTTIKTHTKVPILGSLPLIGRLFQKQDDSIERSNLLIFVTAQLINPSGARLASYGRE